MANTPANITTQGIDGDLNFVDTLNQNLKNLKDKDVQNYNELQQAQQAHVNNTEAHPAQNILFSSDRPTISATDTKSAIEQVDSRVDEIIKGQDLDPNKDIELTSSRVSSVYGPFDDVPLRLDNTDNILNSHAAYLDMLSPYYARQNRIYLGEVSRKLRFGENVSVCFYGDSNAMGNAGAYQIGCMNALNGIYKNKIYSVDRAYAGDSAQASFNRWTTTHTGDISIICYGANDSTIDFGYPDDYMNNYINWIEKLMIREIEWGKAVILAAPIPTRNDTRWETPTNICWTDPSTTTTFRGNVYSFAAICKWIAEKYSVPFIDNDWIANYEDDIYKYHTECLGVYDASSYGDPIHIVAEIASIWGIRTASILIGDSLINPQKACNNVAFATRKGIDPFTTTIDTLNKTDKRVLYNGDGYAFATGDNIVGNRYLQMVADDEITYSFYTDTENLIVYPIMYIFSSSAVDVKLDYGQRQPFAVINDLLSTSSKSSILNFSTQAAAEFNIVKGMTPTNPKSLTYNEKGIVITSKGWHTLNVKCNTGNVAVSGIKFKDA